MQNQHNPISPLVATVETILSSLNPRDQVDAGGDVLKALARYRPVVDSPNPQPPQDDTPEPVQDGVESRKGNKLEKVEIQAENLEQVEIDALIERLDYEQRIIARSLARGDRKIGDLANEVGRSTRTVNNWIKEGHPLALLGIKKKSVGVLTWPNPIKVPLD